MVQGIQYLYYPPDTTLLLLNDLLMDKKTRLEKTCKVFNGALCTRLDVPIILHVSPDMFSRNTFVYAVHCGLSIPHIFQTTNQAALGILLKCHLTNAMEGLLSCLLRTSFLPVLKYLSLCSGYLFACLPVFSADCASWGQGSVHTFICVCPATNTIDC